MNAREFSAPVTEVTKKAFPHAERDDFILFDDATSMLDHAATLYPHPRLLERERDTTWCGGLSFHSAIQTARKGDLSTVETSEKFLAELEDAFPAPTSKRQIVDDVTGAFANVPAMLAGQPLNMRRKAKAESEFSPLAVVVNLGSSAYITAKQVKTRGTAILALVRALSARRPVELWCGVTATGKKPSMSNSVYFRIETAPMDLAHAAHLITHPSISRLFLYQILISTMKTHNGSIPWQYDECSNAGKIRDTFAPIIGRGFVHVDEVLAVPMIHMDDAAMKSPVEWVKKMVKQYAGDELQGD